MPLLINNQTIEEIERDSRSKIQQESLEDIEGVLGTGELTNDEKVHLIESCFIMKRVEQKQLDEKIEELNHAETFLREKLGGGAVRCADCDGSCETDVPDGQLDMFEVMGN